MKSIIFCKLQPDSLKPLLGIYSSIVVLTDKKIEKLHGLKLLRALPAENRHLISIRPGELSKSRATKEKIETALFRAGCDRNTLLIAFGGGVVGDLGGFVAATYMRGIRYISIPTTLLAMVDSSMGGKVAINIPQGKNLIGTYWQPDKIILDLDLLATLSRLQIINGAIESLKMFLTCDLRALNKFETEFFVNPPNLAWLVQRSIEIKSEIVAQDERETELRKILNFGHTLGHAIEKASNYKLLHGVAVGYGILIESKIACLLGHLSESDYQKIKNILVKMDLDFSVLNHFDVDYLISLMTSDKKNQNQQIYFVLLNGLGSIYKTDKVAHPVPEETIQRAITAVLRGA